MPATPTSASASRTSSSLNGLMIAMTIFIARPPSRGGQHNGCGILRPVGAACADGRSRGGDPRWWPDTGGPMNASIHYGNRHPDARSEEHTSGLQSREKLVCRLLLEQK